MSTSFATAPGLATGTARVRIINFISEDVEDILGTLIVAESTEEERDTFVALAILRIDSAENLHSQRKILNDVSMCLEEAMEKSCIVTMLFFAATVIEIHDRISEEEKCAGEPAAATTTEFENWW